MTLPPTGLVGVDVDDPLTDEDLVKAAQQALPGDYRHFETLLRRHQASILTNCRYIVGSADAAEDLAQEVFIKAFFTMDGFEQRSRYRTWLQRIKVNHCLDHLRKGRNRLQLDVDSPAILAEIDRGSEAPPDPREADSNPSLALVRTVLSSLPDPYRVPLVMRDADGYSYQEIAEALGLKLSATKMRIKRAREEFRRLYEIRGKITS